jgi:MHS family alpha-ketoglutarate permease-like MFS transporter
MANKDSGTFSALFKHWRAFCVVLAYTAGGSLSFYTFTTYMPKYLFNTAHIDKVTASQISTAALFVYMIIQPFFGWLSDRIGRKANMLLYSGLGTLMVVPLMTAIGSTQNAVLSFALIMIGLIVISFYTGISGIVKAELFPWCRALRARRRDNRRRKARYYFSAERVEVFAKPLRRRACGRAKAGRGC